MCYAKLHFLLCPNNPFRDGGILAVADAAEQLCDSEIRYLGYHLPVKENVGRLEISVDHSVPRVLVKVEKPSGYPKDDAHPGLPAQSGTPPQICW